MDKKSLITIEDDYLYPGEYIVKHPFWGKKTKNSTGCDNAREVYDCIVRGILREGAEDKSKYRLGLLFKSIPKDLEKYMPQIETLIEIKNAQVDFVNKEFLLRQKLSDIEKILGSKDE